MISSASEKVTPTVDAVETTISSASEKVSPTGNGSGTALRTDRPISPTRQKLAAARALDSQLSPREIVASALSDLISYITSGIFDLSKQASLMIVASFLADASTMPLHWIYDQTDIKAKVEAAGGLAVFYEPPSCPFYTYESGALSPYGDEVLPTLRSVAATSELSTEAAASLSYDTFKTYTGRLNHAAKMFVEARDAGKPWEECVGSESIDAHSLTKAAVVVARYAGTPALIDQIDMSTKLLQTAPVAITGARLFARLLEHVLLTGDSPATTIGVWGLSAEAAFPEEERKLLELLTSEEKLTAWCGFCSKLAKVPKSPENPYLSMLVQRNVLLLLLSEGSLEAAVAHESLAAEHQAVVDAALAEEAAEVSLADISQVISAFGLSCALPGSVLSALYVALRTTNIKEVCPCCSL